MVKVQYVRLQNNVKKSLKNFYSKKKPYICASIFIKQRQRYETIKDYKINNQP